MDSDILVDLIVHQGLLDAESATALRVKAESADIFDLLEAEGCGSRVEILQMVAEFKRYEFVDLGSVSFPRELLTALPFEIVTIYKCFPVAVSSDSYTICLVDPLDDVAVTELGSLLGRRIEVCVADPALVAEVIESLEGGSWKNASFVEMSRSAPVAVSLGTNETNQLAAGPSRDLSGLRMVALALLSVASVATLAIYFGQQKVLHLSQDVVHRVEEVAETQLTSRLVLEGSLSDFGREMDRLTQLLDRNEVDAIKLAQVEADMRRLEGKLESVRKIQAGREPEEAVGTMDSDLEN